MSRAAVVGTGALAGLVAAALAGLALVGTAALATGVFAVQVVVALAWLAALDAKGAVGGFAIAVAAAAAMDIVIGVEDGPDIGRAAPVAGVVLVVALLHQLSRRPRTELTVSLAATLSAVVLGVCAASYVALLGESRGDDAVAAALLGAGAALLVARGVDVLVPRPVLFPNSRRGVVGIVMGAVAAVAVGAGYGDARAPLGTSIGLRVAVIAAVLALLGDVAVDAVLTNAPPPDERRHSALTPLGVLLPVVLAGPVAYVAGRILLG